jgi:hypothetical protein
VFPDADSVDPEAVALVSPEWALTHLTLPIMKTADTLTVIVDSPLKTDAVDELASRTDRRIQLALAGPGKIRELIRQVYARASARDEGERPAPVSLEDAVGLALNAGAARFGVSTRKARTWFWYDDSGTIRRRPLEGLWSPELERMVEPSAAAQTQGKDRARWNGRLARRRDRDRRRGPLPRRRNRLGVHVQAHAGEGASCTSGSHRRARGSCPRSACCPAPGRPASS